MITYDKPVEFKCGILLSPVVQTVCNRCLRYGIAACWVLMHTRYPMLVNLDDKFATVVNSEEFDTCLAALPNSLQLLVLGYLDWLACQDHPC